MEELLKSLDAVLDAQIEGYRLLLSDLHREQTAATTLKADALEDATGHKAKTVKHLQKLEAKRLGIVANLAGVMGLSSERITLADIIERAPDSYRPRLVTRRQQLLESTRAIGPLNRQNQDIFRHSLSIVRQALQLLHQTQASPEYHADGRVRDAHTGGRMVSSDV